MLFVEKIISFKIIKKQYSSNEKNYTFNLRFPLHFQWLVASNAAILPSTAHSV
jgi:hypothetical protein